MGILTQQGNVDPIHCTNVKVDQHRHHLTIPQQSNDSHQRLILIDRPDSQTRANPRYHFLLHRIGVTLGQYRITLSTRRCTGQFPCSQMPRDPDDSPTFTQFTYVLHELRKIFNLYATSAVIENRRPTASGCKTATGRQNLTEMKKIFQSQRRAGRRTESRIQSGQLAHSPMSVSGKHSPGPTTESTPPATCRMG